MSIESTKKTTTLLRRFLAIFYDSLLLLAILFIITALANQLNQGRAISPSDSIYPFYILSIVSFSFIYFSWFWIHGGQTLGMKTWKIKLILANNNNPKKINYNVCALRFFTAIFSWLFFGIGFVWVIFNNNNRSWHDILSSTDLIDISN